VSRVHNLKIGYDNNADDDIDDVDDDLVVDEAFSSTSVTVSHDHAGNLIDDGTYRYGYDAPALDSPPGLCPAMRCIGRFASAACQGCESPGEGPGRCRRRGGDPPDGRIRRHGPADQENRHQFGRP